MPYGGNPSLPAFRNAIINGDMSIAQIGSTAGVISWDTASNLNYESTDQFGVRGSAGIGITGTDTQFADHPLLGAQGFCKRLLVTNPEVVGVNENLVIASFIEGFNWAPFYNQNAAVSFWVKSSLPGTYTFLMMNAAGAPATVKYWTEYTVYQANTWEQKVFGLPVNYPDVAANWNYTNGVGLRVIFPLFGGANVRGVAPLNQWITGSNTIVTQNSVNWGTTAADDFRITDVQIEQGNYATPFERKNFQTNLFQCQRYYWHTFNYGQRPAASLGINAGACAYMIPVAGIFTSNYFRQYPVPMRAAPTMTFYNTNAAGTAWRAAGVDSGASGQGANHGATQCHITNAQAAGDTVGLQVALHVAYSSRLV